MEQGNEKLFYDIGRRDQLVFVFTEIRKEGWDKMKEVIRDFAKEMPDNPHAKWICIEYAKKERA